MEHRWGERIAVRVIVELSCGSSPAVAGSLENISSSGAFVRTHGRGLPRGPVQVSFVERGAGVGLEWREFAPRLVRQLMVRNRGAGGARAAVRAPRASLHLPRVPNPAMQPRAQPGALPGAIGANTLPVAASAAAEWVGGPIGRLPIQRRVLEPTAPGSGPPGLAAAAR